MAVNDIEGRYQYPDIVRFEIEEQDLESYGRAADFLNSSNVDVVSVQHERRASLPLGFEINALREPHIQGGDIPVGRPVPDAI